jgi:hypothetical protein
MRCARRPTARWTSSRAPRSSRASVATRCATWSRVTAPRDYGDFLADMVEACRSIIEFVGDMTLDAYLSDRKTRFIVMRGFEMMGEAVRHVPATVKDANPDIP